MIISEQDQNMLTRIFSITKKDENFKKNIENILGYPLYNLKDYSLQDLNDLKTEDKRNLLGIIHGCQLLEDECISQQQEKQMDFIRKTKQNLFADTHIQEMVTNILNGDFLELPEFKDLSLKEKEELKQGMLETFCGLKSEQSKTLNIGSLEVNEYGNPLNTKRSLDSFSLDAFQWINSAKKEELIA
jgi:hypothetical protein